MMSNNSEGAIPKLVDFGLTSILGPGQTQNEPLGTLEYCAPEIILGKNYGLEIDIWSLGIILYRIMSADLPYEDINKDKLVYKIIKTPVRFDDKIWGKISENAKSFIL